MVDGAAPRKPIAPQDAHQFPEAAAAVEKGRNVQLPREGELRPKKARLRLLRPGGGVQPDLADRRRPQAPRGFGRRLREARGGRRGIGARVVAAQPERVNPEGRDASRQARKDGRNPREVPFVDAHQHHALHAAAARARRDFLEVAGEAFVLEVRVRVPQPRGHDRLKSSAP